MSEYVFCEGSYGEGEVWLRESIGGGADPITGRISLEGTWVHVKSEGSDVTLPQSLVASIDWKGAGRRWP